MKRLVVGDLHFGVNEKDSNFIDYQNKSLDWIISLANSSNLPCDFLGDLFDNSKSVTHTSIGRFQNFLGSINNVGVVIVGNHDTHYKHDSKFNIVSLLENGSYVVSDFNPVELDNCIYLPWINSSTIDNVMSALRKTNKKICLGHLELSGFLLQKGFYSSTDHLSKSDLSKFDLVVSGHYHIHSKQNNIIYLGTPYQSKLYDVNVNKYIMILDTSTGEYELIQNPYVYYVEVVVDNDTDLPDIQYYLDKKVKVYLNVARTIKIEKWLNELQEKNNNISILDNYTLNLMDTKIENVDNYSSSVEEVWDEYLQTLDEEMDIQYVDSIFKEELLKIKQGAG